MIWVILKYIPVAREVGTQYDAEDLLPSLTKWMPSDLLANPFSTSSPVVSSAATETTTVNPDDSFDVETVCEVDIAADCHDPSFNLSEATMMTYTTDNSVSVYSDDK